MRLFFYGYVSLLLFFFCRRLLVVVDVGRSNVCNVCSVLCYLGFNVVYIYIEALFEQFRGFACVAQQELCHDYVGSHLHEAARNEVEVFLVALRACFCYGSLGCVGHCAYACFD